MDISFFFKGKLAREESASAFLAMLLKDHAGFRQHFFEALECNCSSELAAMRFEKVEVEHKNIDVAMLSERFSVLIENKIQAGSVTKDQLLRYYEVRPADRRTVMVYLAPQGAGVEEVRRFKSSKAFLDNPADEAVHLSWDSLWDFRAAPEDPWAPVVEKGLETIRDAIRDAATESFKLEDRTAIVELANNSAEVLRGRFDKPALSRWRGRDCELVITNKSPVTVYADVSFSASEDGVPREVVGPNGELSLTVRLQFRISAQGRKEPGIRAQWEQLAKTSPLLVPELGEFKRDGGGWFANLYPAKGSQQHLSELLAERTSSLFRFLAPYARPTGNFERRR